MSEKTYTQKILEIRQELGTQMENSDWDRYPYLELEDIKTALDFILGDVEDYLEARREWEKGEFDEDAKYEELLEVDEDGRLK